MDFVSKKYKTAKQAIAMNSAHDIVTGCWNWTAYTNRQGYGVIRISRHALSSAHRLSYEAFCGKIGEGMCVCHTCDNRRCVNPAHLWMGTHQQNMDDRGTKGRSSGGDNRGSRNGMSKITEDDVLEIRRLVSECGRTQTSVATEYGLTQGTVSMIVNRINWRHL